MNVTFQETGSGNNGGPMPSSSQQRCRQFVEQLRKFIISADTPNATAAQAGAGISDVGFALLRLKEQLLNRDQRNLNFPTDFASKQFNGLVLLIKVVVVLQGIVNLVNNKSSKFSSLLNRKNSATNVRRKASVSEADCMECIKLVLEKAPQSWQNLLENLQNLEVIVYSISSPQLDSKCYSLEIILGLLDHAHGFEHLFRALTVISARTGDYHRLAIIVSQLKHGLHTSKLHIQILVARLMNKLLLRAPSPAHRLLAQSEATLAHFSSSYIDKLLASVNGQLGGREALAEELNTWHSLCVSATHSNSSNSTRSNDSANANGNHRMSQIPASFDSSEDSQGGKNRRPRTTTFKAPIAQTSVTKNIERQRLRRHGETQNFYNQQEGSMTLTKSIENRHEGDRGRYSPHKRYDNDFMGRMRRVKSESAMGGEESEEENYGTTNRRLKRFGEHEQHSDYATPPPTYHGNGQALNGKMSQSIHDLSMAHMTSPTFAESIPRRSAEAPGKFYTGNMMYPGQNPSESATMNRILRRTVSPAYSNSSSQFENGGLPGYPSSQLPPPHAGFSYLFPALPIIDRVVGRSKTPEVYAENRPVSPESGLPPRVASSSSNNYEYQSVAASPRSHPIHISQGSDPSSNVVYIPINMIEKKPDMLSPRMVQASSTNGRFNLHASMASPNGVLPNEPIYNKYDKRRQTDNGIYAEAPIEKHEKPHPPARTPHYSGSTNLGEDVRDALREFDYLNDYDENVSLQNDTLSHNNNPTAIYHF